MKRELSSRGALAVLVVVITITAGCGGGDQDPPMWEAGVGIDAAPNPPDGGGTPPDGAVGDCTSAADCVDDNPCTDEVCDFLTNTCMFPPAAEGATCDADGDGCTEGDACSGGRCVPGERPSCDDMLSCTSDSCIATSPTEHRCESELSSGCLVEGACYEDGAEQPDNACQHCDASSPLVWSSSGATSCDDGNACTQGDMCQPDGTCAGRPADASEPNDTRGDADPLGRISDSDSYPSGMFRRNLFPAMDEDWFSFHDEDTRLGFLYPQVELLGIPAGQNYDLCAYYDCDTETLGLSCPRGAPHTAMDGLQGCCSRAEMDGDELVRLSPSCRTTDESGTVYVRVYRVSGDPICADYTVRWGDN